MKMRVTSRAVDKKLQVNNNSGSHIRTLLVTLFFRLMPELIEAGYVYAACPPLYRIIQGKNIIYCLTDKDLEKETAKLKEKGANNYMVTYFKGLGEMNPKDLFDTTLDKNNRRLVKIELTDRSKADEVVSSIMGRDAKTRKDMIIKGEGNVRDYS